MITTNIDVSDGICNGAIGKLLYIDRTEDSVTRIWLEFPSALRIGEKIRRKVSAFLQANNINRNAVPIARRTANIALNNNKTIHAKRNHTFRSFRLVR